MNNLLNLKSYCKFLSRNKSFTLIEILGLSVSLMFVILISVYTSQELSTDHFQKNADRTYVLGNEKYLISAYGIGERLMDRFPEIEKVMTLSSGYTWNGSYYLPVSHEDRKAKAKIQYTYPDFFNFFSFELINGNKEQVLEDKNYAVISESFANQFFPGQNPIGQVIKLTDDIPVTINGVMKDISKSVVPYCDLLVRIEKLTEMYPEMNKDNYGNSMNSAVFLQTKEGTDLQSKSKGMATYLKEFYWLYEKEQVSQAVLMPLKECYFSSYGEFTVLERGDRTFVMILISVGILILIFALINYINLTVAQTGFRAKEAAIRSLLGSAKNELFIRLILESTFLSLVSFIIGLFAAFLFVPYANALVDTKIDLAGAVSPVSILAVILLITLLGFITGFLPAIHITQAKAIDVVKGSFRLKTKMTFSKIFITFQHAITIAMLVASAVMILQLDYMIKAPLGYQTKNIMDIPVVDLQNEELIHTLTNELNRQACVNRVGFARGTPFDRGTNHTMSINGKIIGFQSFEMDTTAFNILGLQILKDNHLASGEGCFLSEDAFTVMGIDDQTKSFPFFNKPRSIAGKIKGFQINNITMDKSPLFVQLDKSNQVEIKNLLVEVQGDPFQSFNEIKDIYERVIRVEFPGKYVEQQIQESFAAQEKTSKIVSVFSFIAVVISLLGLIAMSTYFIQQRAREIAVRKVFGANDSQVLNKLIKTFLNYVVIAFVITTPIIWYIMHQWLSDYSYRISLNPLIFIAVGTFCLLVSFITVFWQSYEAANQNPITNIKTE